jgi:phosphoribosyl 1,2-cyclic phosphodiesterase
MEITFWGVRGSIPVSGGRYQKVGGNTSCVSVLVNNENLVVFDAGSGIYELGRSLATTTYKDINLVLTHLHLDHILGLPFFSPVWDSHSKINLYSAHNDLEHFLETQLFRNPIFPVDLKHVAGRFIFHQISVGKPLLLSSNAVLNSHKLHHPGGAVGYRLEEGDKSICYITDTEHEPGVLDEGLIEFIKGTNLFIYDSAYTEEEYERKRGWGHSTHIHAAELARAAGVQQLALFHHDPAHDDHIVAQIEAEAQKIFPATFAAREGIKIKI